MWDSVTIWNVGAAGIAVVGVGLLAWALFADRARGRLRCPGCWYDMRGAAADEAGVRKCPECGRGGLRERSLRRTRRRWRLALAAIPVLIVADQVSRVPALREHGWVGLVPTTAIIPLAPVQSERWVRQTVGDGAHLHGDSWAWMDELREELFRRDYHGESWTWQGSAWAVLAAWRPMGDGEVAFRSFYVGDILHGPPWDIIDLSGGPRIDDMRRDLLDIVMQNVGFDTWVDNGGDQGLAGVLGDRLLLINSADNVRDVGTLLGQIRHPSTRGATPIGAPSVRFGHSDWERVVFDLERWLDPARVEWGWRNERCGRIADLLLIRIAPDEWVDNGGEGLSMSWFEGRLIVCGRPSLVAEVGQSLHAIIAAAIEELEAESRESGDEIPTE